MSGSPARSSWGSVPCEDLPDGTILFDGVCVLCSAWFHFVARRDPAIRFCFVAVQEPYGRWLAGRLGIDPDAPETNAVVVAGRAYFRSDAAIEVLRQLPGWRWTPLLRAVPRPVRDRLYAIVARNRYRLFGKTDACMVPTPELWRHLATETPL
jgi:predicted DCC family thiol-disulfide oxidoreductase YuxK